MRIRMIAVLVSFWAAVGVVAQPLADRVPGDALIYIGWAGAESMGPGYSGSHLEAVLKESKFNELIGASLPKIMQKIGATEREAAEFISALSAIGGPVWRHPSAFYFGGLNTTNPQGQPIPKFAVLCQAGADAPGMVRQLKQFLEKAQPPFPITVEERAGLVVYAAGNKGWGAGQVPAAALKADKNFTAALGQVQTSGVAAVYVDVEGAVKLVDGLIGGSPQGQHWAKARDLLGLGGVRRFVWTSGFDGKDWMSRAFVDAPAPRMGAIPTMFGASPLSQEILKSIPQTATVAMAGKFDLGALVAGIRSAVGQIDPQAGQQVDEAFNQARQVLGFDPQADLFDALGDEWAVYVDPMTAGQGMLGFSVVNRAKNAGKVEASLTRLETTANALLAQNMPPEVTLTVKQTKVGATTLHSLAVPLVSPTWSVKDGNLYLGLYPQVVEAAVDQVASKNKSILENGDFLAVRKRLGDVPASGLTYANLPKTAPDGYQEILMVTRMYQGFADLFGADTPAMLLPPLRKIMPHLSPAGSVSWTDAAGWHSKSVSPFPGSTALTPGGGGQVLIAQQAMLVSILLPSLNRARETANRVKCGSNMRMIGQGILLYSNENKGNYPPDQGMIVKTQDLVADVFVCPSGDSPQPPKFKNPDEAAKWVNEHSDYVYLGAGMNNRIGADVIVLYEKPGAHEQQGMNILFGDGHVEWVPLANATRMIQDQQAGKKGAGGL